MLLHHNHIFEHTVAKEKYLKKVKKHYIILNKTIILYHSRFVNIWDSSSDLIAPKTFHIIKKMI